MFCPTCGNQVPDDTKFCPGCGTPLAQAPAAANAAPAAENAVPAASTKKQKREPGKVRKLLFGSMSVGGIIVFILVIQIGKYLAKQGVKAVMNPEPSAIEQQDTTPEEEPAEPTTTGDDEVTIDPADMEAWVMEHYGNSFALTDCNIGRVDNQLQIELYSSVTSDSADAATLAANFRQELLSESSSSDSAALITWIEQELGVTGITERDVLYYADGTICGEALFDSTGLVDYRI